MLLLQAECEQKMGGIIRQGKEKALNQKKKVRETQTSLNCFYANTLLPLNRYNDFNTTSSKGINR